MTLTTAKYRWLVLAVYPATGLFLGLADPLLGRLVQQLGTKPGVARYTGPLQFRRCWRGPARQHSLLM